MLEESEITCPYCWETIVIELDLSAGSQVYTEDCQVCCRPIVVHLRVADDGEGFEVDARAEDE
jgi:hypothetical protein